jgi:hypothetical protein
LSDDHVSSTRRKFRFVRKAARAQWYIEPWLYGSLALSLPALIFLLDVQRSVVAWSAGGVVTALLAWRWEQQYRYEAAFWEQKSKYLVWFEDGRLCVSANDVPLPESEPLSDISAIDALEEKGSVIRLLVDKKNGTKTIYAGFDDMEAFAREFRLNASQAKFRRVRLGFPMKLKEI